MLQHSRPCLAITIAVGTFPRCAGKSDMPVLSYLLTGNDMPAVAEICSACYALLSLLELAYRWASFSTPQLTCHQFTCILQSSRCAAATAKGLLMLRHVTSCRLDSDAKSSQVAEVTESKEGLEAKLLQLTEAHSMLTQQHEGLTTEMTQVQGTLQTAVEGRAQAEVQTSAYAMRRQLAFQSIAG